MRPIKFRAWDKKNKRMVEVVELAGLICFGAEISGNWGQIRPSYSNEWLLVPRDAELMQFTGLCDKNGKEIYEGDIVRLMTHKAHYTGEKDKYRQEIVTNGCRCGLNTNGLLSIQKEGQEEYEPQMEILGNIHDNPELMSGDTE